MSNTYTIHRQMGQFATPARFAEFAKKAGISAKEASSFLALKGEAARIAWLEEHVQSDKVCEMLSGSSTGNACDLARDVFNRAGLGPSGLRRARTVYAETRGTYPQGIETLLTSMTKEFNDIKDAEIINTLQKNMVARIDDASVGLALAKEVREAVARVRRKDLLAANIALLVSVYDQALAAEEQYHREMTRVEDKSTHDLLVKLFGVYEREGDMSDFSPDELLALRRFVEVPLDTPAEELTQLLHAYMKEASESQAVESQMVMH